MAALERPKLVDVSVALLATLLIVGLLRAVFGREISAAGTSVPFVYGLLFVTNALAAGVIAKISDGVNWARIVYALVIAFGALRSFALLGSNFSQVSATALLDIGLLLAEVVAVALLFLPASASWFRRAAQQA